MRVNCLVAMAKAQGMREKEGSLICLAVLGWELQQPSISEIVGD